MNYHPLRSPLAASLFGGLLALVAACGNDAPPTGSAVIGRDSLPVMVTQGVSKLISDSGIMRYKIIAEEWRIFDKTAPPRWEFPKGILIERYDNFFKVNLFITADSAWLYDQKTWKLRGNIRLHDLEAQTNLTTQEMTWNMRTGELASNVYTRLVEPTQAIEGNWFRATILNDRLTRYHVKQSKGFMPMGHLGEPTPAAPAPAAPPTEMPDTQALQPLPSREAPTSHPKLR